MSGKVIHFDTMQPIDPKGLRPNQRYATLAGIRQRHPVMTASRNGQSTFFEGSPYNEKVMKERGWDNIEVYHGNHMTKEEYEAFKAGKSKNRAQA